ncbi:MAG TPA: hypothetical protein VFP95_00175, partial [Gammaproteobacteria bacterium]|nr:hypothetical protein [Gammaproteobacteria bacterium]
MKYFAYSVFVGVLVLLLAACNVNESIDIPAGATSEGGTTVNGLITVGENAVVSGELSTVNGSIDIGKAARTGDLSTVNGSITVAEKAQVGTIQTVN